MLCFIEVFQLKNEEKVTELEYHCFANSKRNNRSRQWSSMTDNRTGDNQAYAPSWKYTAPLKKHSCQNTEPESDHASTSTYHSKRNAGDRRILLDITTRIQSAKSKMGNHSRGRGLGKRASKHADYKKLNLWSLLEKTNLKHTHTCEATGEIKH